MENQQQPQPPPMAARPWFRLASIRTDISAAAAAAAVAPPVAAPTPPQPAAPPAPERPLLRVGSLLRIPTSTPPPQEPTPATTQPQARAPTPPPTVPTSPAPPPVVPPSPAIPNTQDQQQPRQAPPPTVSPSLAVRALSPPPPVAVRAPSPPAQPLMSPAVPAVMPQQQQPLLSRQLTPVSPPPPPPLVTVVSPAPAPAPAPRPPSPPLHPEPETKPVVSVVAARPALIQLPTSNGNGGKTNLGVTQGDQLRGATPPPSSPISTPKKQEPAAAPAKKKSGATDEAESRLRVLTLAGENMGAHMTLGGFGHRGGSKGQGQGRLLTETQPAQGMGKVSSAVLPGSGGGKFTTGNDNYYSDIKGSTEPASKRNVGAESAKPMAALVNSNVQSVNNSIMFNSSCTQQSPGVHITLSSAGRRPSSRRLSGDSNGTGYGGGTATDVTGDGNGRANH